MFVAQKRENSYIPVGVKIILDITTFSMYNSSIELERRYKCQYQITAQHQQT
jgi:hypothetical protein